MNPLRNFRFELWNCSLRGAPAKDTCSLEATFLGNRVTKIVTFQKFQTQAKDQAMVPKQTLIDSCGMRRTQSLRGLEKN